MGLVIQIQGSMRTSRQKCLALGASRLLHRALAVSWYCEPSPDSPLWGGGTVFVLSLIIAVCSWVLVFMTRRCRDSFAWTCLCFWNWSSCQKVPTSLNVQVWSSFISCLFAWWKGSGTASPMVVKWEGPSFFLALEIIALLELLSLRSLIC